MNENDMKEYFRLDSKAYNEVLEELRAKRKISAIKLYRNATECGLKEAKQAVERIQHEKFDGFPVPGAYAPRTIVGPVIKRLILDYGEGEVEIDLEGMQLRALMDMQSIGLDSCRDMLDLVEILTAISSGRKVTIEPEEDTPDKDEN